MLPPEQARATLESLRDADARGRTLRRLSGLPTSEMRRAGLAFAGDVDRNTRLAATSWLSAASEADRQQVFDALFPHLAGYVEGAWQLLGRLPYQQHAQRKAFRAPHTPEVTWATRGRWLADLYSIVTGYEQDIRWFAAWAPYLAQMLFRYSAPETVGLLCAAAIDAGGPVGEEVYNTLVASAKGEHAVGIMGRHVTRALLVASRPEGWEFIERLLLAAQREEGLRQVILETVDEAHPEAFRRLLRVILENRLVRFSAVVRAADVWFGLGWDSGSPRPVYEALSQALRFLEDPQARAEVLQSGSGQALYLALWTLAYEDAAAAIEPAARLLADPVVERRFVGAHLLAQLDLWRSDEALLTALADEDLHVVARAVQSFQRGIGDGLASTDLFERLEQLLARLKRRKSVTLKPLVWPWLAQELRREVVAGLLPPSLGSRSPARLTPYVPLMSSHDRAQAVRRLAEAKEWNDDVRSLFLSLVGDASSLVRSAAVDAVAKHSIRPEVAVPLEDLLRRKPGDLRRGVLSLLLHQPDPAALASAGRLLAAGDALQRQAGLELLRLLVEAKRSPADCRMMAQGFRERGQMLTNSEQAQVDAILRTERRPATLDDALGLLDPRQRTAPEPPAPRQGLLGRLFQRPQPPLVSEAAVACLRSLDELVHAHRDTPVTLATTGGPHEEILGNLTRGFTHPDPKLPEAEDRARLPLADLWENWWAGRPHALRDDDGLELLRAQASLMVPHWARSDPAWMRKARRTLFAGFDPKQIRYTGLVRSLLDWLLRLHPPAGAAECLLHAVQVTFSLVPAAELANCLQKAGQGRVSPFQGFAVVPTAEFTSRRQNPRRDWRSYYQLFAWLGQARRYRGWQPGAWTPEQRVRLWRLLHWLDEPVPGAARWRPQFEETLAAWKAGAATEADLMDHLLGPRSESYYGFSGFQELRDISGRTPSRLEAAYPILSELASRCRERILEIELARGETPTAATAPAFALRWSGGLDALIRVLCALGKERLVRGWAWDYHGRAAVFSRLVRSSYPSEADTPEAFAAQVEAAGIPRRRLIEVAVYAPQWAAHVEHALGWPGLAEAVGWLHAHTKDMGWQVDREIRETWTAEVAERTPLAGQSLLDGAVDVAWFRQVYETLGAERWQEVYRAAEYASSGAGYKRARLYADALLGELDEETLIARIRGKRHKDAVGALGLLPLPPAPEREAALLRRYETLQEFLRTSRKFGSQRQASEKLAFEIGLQNLARTAGYRDPLRLQWAMESRANADLAAGPVTVTANGVTVALSVDVWGEPQLSVSRGDRPLKAVPAKLRKVPDVAALTARQRELRQQAARVRRSLEEAMCRGDAFAAGDLRQLLAHPLLAPRMEDLVFVGDGVMGYPVEGGRALLGHDGGVQPLHEGTELRIAHPCDLLAGEEWHAWQRDCFVAERKQPFKQVFRELYVLTTAEREEGTLSRRYGGQQVNGNQAVALWKSRGWVVHPEDGIRRTFHEQGIAAWVNVLGLSFTPADVEGLTIEGVGFSRRGDWRPLNLAEIPPRLFSEVMRDVDLVVSVAHRGGVDPEASASTIEMRTALLEETLALLKIGNVRLQPRHALIEGRLGSYSVHLGSGTVHRQPGGALCIVPVHAQHRGRLFLPFADDDPRTAEVLSKVLLLARDYEIKDPTILEQILAKG